MSSRTCNSTHLFIGMFTLQVIECSREVIDLKFGFGDPAFLQHQQDTADKLGKSSKGGMGGEVFVYLDEIASLFSRILRFELSIVVSILLVSGVNLESADAQEIGITYEMMQVCECS